MEIPYNSTAAEVLGTTNGRLAPDDIISETVTAPTASVHSPNVYPGVPSNYNDDPQQVQKEAYNHDDSWNHGYSNSTQPSFPPKHRYSGSSSTPSVSHDYEPSQHRASSPPPTFNTLASRTPGPARPTLFNDSYYYYHNYYNNHFMATDDDNDESDAHDFKSLRQPQPQPTSVSSSLSHPWRDLEQVSNMRYYPRSDRFSDYASESFTARSTTVPSQYPAHCGHDDYFNSTQHIRKVRHYSQEFHDDSTWTRRYGSYEHGPVSYSAPSQVTGYASSVDQWSRSIHAYGHHPVATRSTSDFYPVRDRSTDNLENGRGHQSGAPNQDPAYSDIDRTQSFARYHVPRYDISHIRRRYSEGLRLHEGSSRSFPVYPKSNIISIARSYDATNRSLIMPSASADELMSIQPAFAPAAGSDDKLFKSSSAGSDERSRVKIPSPRPPSHGGPANTATTAPNLSTTFMPEVGRKYQRTIFKPEQLKALKEAFKREPSPSSADVNALALQLGLAEKIVRIWFQNRRVRHLAGTRLDREKKKGSV